MPKFTVDFLYTEYGSTEVEADTAEEAEVMVEDMWGDGDIPCYKSDFEISSVNKEEK